MYIGLHRSAGLELRWVTSLILKRKGKIVPVDLPLCLYLGLSVAVSVIVGM